MKIYADSSFIYSLYNRQPQTPVALRQFEEIKSNDGSILLTDLARLETTNAAQLGVFRKDLSTQEGAALLTTFTDNIDAGLFQVVPSSPLIWKTAERLSHEHTAEIGCRSLDIVHIASALLLNADLFLTFDNRQRTLAVAAGLNAPDLLADPHS